MVLKFLIIKLKYSLVTRSSDILLEYPNETNCSPLLVDRFYILTNQNILKLKRIHILLWTSTRHLYMLAMFPYYQIILISNYNIHIPKIKGML